MFEIEICLVKKPKTTYRAIQRNRTIKLSALADDRPILSRDALDKILTRAQRRRVIARIRPHHLVNLFGFLAGIAMVWGTHS